MGGTQLQLYNCGALSEVGCGFGALGGGDGGREVGRAGEAPRVIRRLSQWTPVSLLIMAEIYLRSCMPQICFANSGHTVTHTHTHTHSDTHIDKSTTKVTHCPQTHTDILAFQGQLHHMVLNAISD